MTTATPGNRATAVAPGVRGAVLGTLAVGLLAVAAAAVTGTTADVLGAAVGAGMVLAFFAFGALTVNSVASVLPGASLLVALLTYTLQVVLLALVFLGLKGSGLTDADLDSRWLGVTAIIASLSWIVMQTLGAVRARQPLYDLPRSQDGPAGESRGGGHAA